MKRVEELKQAYQSILSSHRGKTRKLLLQSVKEQLRELEGSSKKEEMLGNKTKLQITETNDTNTSHISFISNSNSNDLFVSNNILSTSITGTDQFFELEARILEKQRHKFALNQEIQSLQDQYLGLQQTIFEKKEKTGALEKLIAWKSYQIAKTSMEDHQQVEEQQSLAKKIMCFFLF